MDFGQAPAWVSTPRDQRSQSSLQAFESRPPLEELVVEEGNAVAELAAELVVDEGKAEAEAAMSVVSLAVLALAVASPLAFSSELEVGSTTSTSTKMPYLSETTLYLTIMRRCPLLLAILKFLLPRGCAMAV